MNHSVRWTPKKIGQRLALIEPLVYRKRQEIAPFRVAYLESPLEKPPVGVDYDDSAWEVIAANTYWGDWEQDYILRTEITLSTDWDADAALALYLPLGEAGDFSHPEGLVYLDGVSYAACDRHHQEIRLPESLRDGASHKVAIHGWTGGAGGRGRRKTRLLMEPCMIVQVDQPTRDFVAAARVALGTVNTLSENDPARAHLLNALDDAFKLLDIREPFGDAFYDSVAGATETLRTGIEHAGPALDVQLFSTGHAHIDVAWLWTLGQTRRKASRTFHTVMRMMEQFPDYHFTQSQPQLYEFIRQDHPDLFAAIQERVAEGRWEMTGDMWIEADCNLSGAESLARQFLLGRSFFKEHFNGTDSSPVLWLPDVFGYAWALPQLIKQAELEYFFTIKIGWSQYNRLPYDSFWWQGLDGTRVLTHFSTTPEQGSAHASTYNAKATAEDVIGSWTNYRQKDLANRAGSETAPLLMAFGYGDGGGGPTREMLENLRELKNFPSAPQARQVHVGEFFRTLEDRVGEALPTWNGELYLEFHRGTYTTQSRNKRANRKSEFLLHDAELAATIASLVDPSYAYPKDEFLKAWRLICLNQFHDIIPGSSINAVYVESQEQYAEIRALGEQARDAALDTIARAAGAELIVLNPTGFSRDDLAFVPGELPAGTQISRDGVALPSQATEGGTLVATGALSGLSVTALALTSGEAAASTTGLSASESHLENDFLRVELNADGDVSRVYDKQFGREVLAEGQLANQFLAFEDRPMNWDAWDVDIFYDDKCWLAAPASSIRVVESGPLRATILVERTILGSSYTQRISLEAASRRLDFETHIDWRERHVLLKVAFPVDILAPQATYEIQWGNVQRPTHHNTSWDWARFETCAQKWADLSEGDYGVSLLNDCKYGHDIKGNVMRISLLRAPTMPDPEADQGEHTFRYSLLPHGGDWSAAIPEGYRLNDPLVVHRSAAATSSEPNSLAALVATDNSNVVIETVKQAEDGNGVIVRLYESQRRRGPVSIRTGFALAGAYHANLLENTQSELAVEGNSVSLSLHPYEIVTLRLVPA